MKLMAFLSTLVFTNSNKYRVSSVNIKQGMPGDGLVFINDDNPVESVIVNFYTFVSLVKGIMIAYGNKSEGEAESIINNSAMLTVPPQNYLGACLLGHEEEYYWAMVISHGDRYFKKGFSYAAPDSYDEWESKYIKDNNLKTNALIFKDEE